MADDGTPAGTGSSSESTAALQELRFVCEELEAARRRVDELARRRNALVRALRESGVGGVHIADASGLSPGRVSQLADGAADGSAD